MGNNVASAATWLNTNKTGTVFETATITSDQPNEKHWNLTITMGNTYLTVSTRPSDSLGNDTNHSGRTVWTVAYIRAGSGGGELFLASYSGESNWRNFPCEVSINNIIMTKYGMMIQIRSKTGNNSYAENNPTSLNTPYLLTVNDSNELVIIVPTTYSDNADIIAGYMPSTNEYSSWTGYNSMNFPGFKLYCDGKVNTSFSIKPDVDTPGTIIQNFGDYDTSGNGYYTPYAYYSIKSQVTPDDCASVKNVTLNGYTFITNGRWFIMDDD